MNFVLCFNTTGFSRLKWLTAMLCWVGESVKWKRRSGGRNNLLMKQATTLVRRVIFDWCLNFCGACCHKWGLLKRIVASVCHRFSLQCPALFYTLHGWLEFKKLFSLFVSGEVKTKINFMCVYRSTRYTQLFLRGFQRLVNTKREEGAGCVMGVSVYLSWLYVNNHDTNTHTPTRLHTCDKLQSDTAPVFNTELYFLTSSLKILVEAQVALAYWTLTFRENVYR